MYVYTLPMEGAVDRRQPFLSCLYRPCTARAHFVTRCCDAPLYLRGSGCMSHLAHQLPVRPIGTAKLVAFLWQYGFS